MPFFEGQKLVENCIPITNTDEDAFRAIFHFWTFLAIFDHFADFSNFFKNLDFFKILQKDRKKQ
jgi:hypothetical protein